MQASQGEIKPTRYINTTVIITIGLCVYILYIMASSENVNEKKTKKQQLKYNPFLCICILCTCIVSRYNEKRTGEGGVKVHRHAKRKCGSLRRRVAYQRLLPSIFDHRESLYCDHRWKRSGINDSCEQHPVATPRKKCKK
ncbi:hypothetical protein M378DRAFT_308952 [Amanita muscaria Koide BX008]|uniref:Uncharacterized protein n=1 Tax=Amanita muscaria (strain Koide BX008) TaxID=946122 RepID=A0A0C2S7C0_AMAMK|nr:hypothetical protein M378DRAFT_308952 [Amanita muscaria Koide BX008]